MSGIDKALTLVLRMVRLSFSSVSDSVRSKRDDDAMRHRRSQQQADGNERCGEETHDGSGDRKSE